MKELRVLFLLSLLVLILAVFTIPSDTPQCLAAPQHVLAQSWWDEVNLLSRLIVGEATGEPLMGQVAVASVILNRVQSPEFPNTLPGVIYEPWAFESVGNGFIWSRPPTPEETRAAQLALNGWDPTYGALFFWNPAKPVSPWIWSRQIILEIGGHVFAY